VGDGAPSYGDGRDLRERLSSVPSKPGVYRFLDDERRALYVGKAKELRKRVGSYFRGPGGAPAGRIGDMVRRAADLEWVVTASETEALLLEDNFIKEARPPYNVRLRDDKSYPFIEITLTDEWPRVRFMRGDRKPGNLYFGPYSSARKVRDTLELIGRIFPFRKCKGEKPGRKSGSPCLQYFIKRSVAPCDSRCTPQEYHEIIDQVVEFLRGRMKEVEHRIERDMKEAAQARAFEKAALLRDRLDAVRHVSERQVARVAEEGAFDVVALHQAAGPGANAQVFRIRDGALVDRQTLYLENVADRDRVEVLEEFLLDFYWEGSGVPPEVIVDAEGDLAGLAAALTARRGAHADVRRAQRGPKRRLMELARKNADLAGEAEQERLARGRDAREEALRRLRDALDLPGLPLRIECYDISNLGETNAVGSMVVFEGGRPRKAHYRTFAIRDVTGQDDFAMMRQVVARRLSRLAAAHSVGGQETAVAAAPGSEAAFPSAAAPGNEAAFESAAASGGGTDGAAASAAMTPADAAGYDESFATLPDLLLIDGGKGQLSAALAGMREAGVEVPAAGLAKQREEVFVPGRRDALPLPADDPASLLLQRVRDEAHRFAIGFHRKRRATTMRASLLDEIPGVGPVRRRRIVEYFGSPDRVLAASAEELEAVPGLPRKVAREIHEQLHKAGP
jgi:excinuclease ABC subunit C